MKKTTLILLITLVLAACTSNTIYKKPDNLIPEEQMIEILLDMQIAIGAKAIKNLDNKRGVEYMPLVYAKHDIDSTQFAQSSFYYSTDIDKYHAILKKVKIKLEGKLKEGNEMQAEKDSLEKLANPKTTKKQELVEEEIDSIIK